MYNEDINRVAEWLHKTEAPQYVITSWNRLIHHGID